MKAVRFVPIWKFLMWRVEPQAGTSSKRERRGVAEADSPSTCYAADVRRAAALNDRLPPPPLPNPNPRDPREVVNRTVQIAHREASTC